MTGTWSTRPTSLWQECPKVSKAPSDHLGDRGHHFDPTLAIDAFMAGVERLGFDQPVAPLWQGALASLDEVGRRLRDRDDPASYVLLLEKVGLHYEKVAAVWESEPQRHNALGRGNEGDTVGRTSHTVEDVEFLLEAAVNCRAQRARDAIMRLKDPRTAEVIIDQAVDIVRRRCPVAFNVDATGASSTDLESIYFSG